MRAIGLDVHLEFCEVAIAEAERAAAEQAEAAYKRTVADWQATQAKRKGAGATPGRASSGPSSGQAARQG